MIFNVTGPPPSTLPVSRQVHFAPPVPSTEEEGPPTGALTSSSSSSSSSDSDAVSVTPPPQGLEVSAPGQSKLTVCSQSRLGAEEAMRREAREGPDGAGRSITVHWVAVLVLFLALLSCLVATRTGVVRMGRYVAIGLLSVERQGGKERVGSSNTTDDHPNKNENKAEGAAAFLFLVLAVLVPYSLTFVRSLWCGWRSDRLWPSYKSIALVRGLFFYNYKSNLNLNALAALLAQTLIKARHTWSSVILSNTKSDKINLVQINPI